MPAAATAKGECERGTVVAAAIRETAANAEIISRVIRVLRRVARKWLSIQTCRSLVRPTRLEKSLAQIEAMEGEEQRRGEAGSTKNSKCFQGSGVNLDCQRTIKRPCNSSHFRPPRIDLRDEDCFKTGPLGPLLAY